MKEGADYIKITATGGSTRTSFALRPSFNVEELKAIVDEIHKFGKHAAAHCASSQGISNVLEAGIDTIIHAIHREPDGTSTFRPEIAERIARQGVFVNATMGSGLARVRTLEQKRDSEGLSEEEQAELDTMRQGHEEQLDHFARMRGLGVRMAAGSDSAWGKYKMGGFQYETEAHVAGGMTPMEAIVASTADSARSCWADDTVGTIEEGKQADITVVDGDPSTNVSALWDVADVFLAGDRVDRGNLV